MIDSKSRRTRILELDVLRGLAAACVLCFHYTTNYTRNYLPPYPVLFDFSKGYYGVHLFFMISGFVIFMSLENIKDPFDFIVSRFSRLYPSYWTAVILTFSLVSIFHLPSREVSPKEAMINLTMFQEWFNIKPVDGVYWTLAAEMSFYLLMLLVFLKKGLKHIESLGLLWLVYMIIASRLLWYGHIHMPMIIRHTKLLTYGHLFFAGIIFYNLKTKGDHWTRHMALGLCLLTGYLVRESSGDVFFEAAFFIIFYLFIYGLLSWILSKPLIFLGSISYSLYLIHANMGYIIIRYLFSIKANPWFCFCVPVIFSIVTAAAMTYLIERPAIQWIRQNYAKHKN